MNFERGSEWRKWDLHVHTPLDHEWIDKPNIDFSKQLYEIESDIKEFSKKFVEFAKSEKMSVLAIVDHNFCNDIEKCYLPYIIQEANENEITILPGFEITVKDGSGIHLLVIFKENTKLEKIHEIVKQCFNPGETLNPNNGQVPISNKSIDELKQLLDRSEEEYILVFAHADRENGVLHRNTIQGSRRVAEWKKEFIKIAQISKNPKDFDENSFMGKVIKKIDQYYARDITYIIASDCRTINKTNTTNNRTYLGEKFTWIKADPTFEGLKQIIYESEDRVYVGDEPELLKRVRENPTKFIDKIEINWNEDYKGNKGEWFHDIVIPLNYGMVSIIGNKGNGKSALADIIALCGNAHVNENDFSFLNKERFKKGKLASNFKAKLIWKSGEQKEVRLDENISFDEIERVKYIPQGFFERLTNNIENKEFENEIKKIIFSYVPNEEKLDKKTFDEFIEFKRNNIEQEIDNIIIQIKQLSREFEKLEKKREKSYLNKLKSQKVNKENELEEFQKTKPKEILNPLKNEKLSMEMEEIYNRLADLKKDKDNKEKELNNKNQYLKELILEVENLKNIKKELFIINKIIKNKIEEITPILNKYNLKIESIFKYSLDISKIEEIINKKNKDINSIRNIIKEEYKHNPENLINQLNIINNEIQKLEEQLSDPMRKYQKYLQDLKEWQKRRDIIENEITNLRNEILYIENDLINDIEYIRKQILEKSKEIFTKKDEILNIYSNLKKSVELKIKEYKTIMHEYKINIDVSYKISNNFHKNFLNYINKKRRGYFKGIEESEERIKEIISNYQNINKWDDIKDFINTILNKFEQDDNYIINQVENLTDFITYLYSLNYIEPIYELKLGEKSLTALSPGERGALLIVFYLMLDQNDIPLIIDQPEENLDNESIYKILVHFIREVKKKRQLIIVTHNPNLAIVGDSDQIIHVTIDKVNNNKFIYKSGSIENQEINRVCSRILEGTLKAFDKRRLKYL